MSPDQIYDVFNTADLDNSGEVDEDEWSEFYEAFVQPFGECDEDEDYMLDEAEI